MTYKYTHALILINSKHRTVADIIICMNSYSKLIYILIVDLYLSIFLVGIIELILIRRYS